MTIQINGANGLTFPDTSSQAVASKVLQVVQGTYSTQVSTTSSSWVSSGLSATITPKFATSKILVLMYTPGCVYGPSAASNGNYQVQRNGTFVAGSNNQSGGALVYFSSNGEINWPIMFSALDSPATTSATTYTLYLNSVNSGYVYAQSNNLPGYIQLLEIAP